MRFCPICGSRMTKITLPTGSNIEWRCRCLNTIAGTGDDTLMAEGALEKKENMDKYTVYINNAPHDAATLRVLQKCPKCGLDYMNMLRIGEQETVIMTCSCGHTSSRI